MAMERDRLKSVVESLLFVSDATMNLDRLSGAIEGIDKKEVLSAIQDLQSDYETQDRGIRVVEVGGGYQLRTPKENSDWIRSLLRSKAARMSKPTLETLAIVAYKQPITRGEIEHIRGVSVDGIIATLLERQWVRIVGRKDIPGKPFLYGTTREFLELFNLKDLTGLPTLKEMEEIAQPELPEQEILPVEESEVDSNETSNQ